MKKVLNNQVSDVIEGLNQQADQLKQFLGFAPNHYLTSVSNDERILIEVISSRNDDAKAIINKIELLVDQEASLTWFFQVANRQQTLLKVILDKITTFNVQEELYVLDPENEGWKINNKKLFRKPKVQQLLSLAHLDLFNLLAGYQTVDIKDLVQPLEQETKASIEQKITTETKTIKDAIFRINFFEGSPKFILDSLSTPKSSKIKVLLNEQQLLKLNFNWTRDDLAPLYEGLLTFSKTTKLLLSTLDFYRKVESVQEPVIYTSKLFSKQWLLTDGGKILNQVLDLPSLLQTLTTVWFK